MSCGEAAAGGIDDEAAGAAAVCVGRGDACALDEKEDGSTCLPLGVPVRTRCGAGIVGDATATGELAIFAVVDPDRRRVVPAVAGAAAAPLVRGDGAVGRAEIDLGDVSGVMPVTRAVPGGDAVPAGPLGREALEVGLPSVFEMRPDMYCSTTCCFACRAARSASSCFRFSARSMLQTDAALEDRRERERERRG